MLRELEVRADYGRGDCLKLLGWVVVPVLKSDTFDRYRI